MFLMCVTEASFVILLLLLLKALRLLLRLVNRVSGLMCVRIDYVDIVLKVKVTMYVNIKEK